MSSDRYVHSVSAGAPHHVQSDPHLPDADFLGSFQKGLTLAVTGRSDEVLTFDMVGVDASIANALRRIMISEVPTMAFETVFISNNTSIIQDEVLSHRLGLIPIVADPELFADKAKGAQASEADTLVFKLKTRCTKSKGTGEVKFGSVYSRDLVWEPLEGQAERFEASPPRPVHPDILIARLRPGQEIDIELHAVRGIGQDHAKFSPVGTASYRLLPEVTLTKPVYDGKADKLALLMPGVFDVEPEAGGGGRRVASVARPRECTMSRNYAKDAVLAESITVGRVPDHFLFTVESIGSITASEIFLRSVEILKEKAETVLAALDGE